jgi:hypothetical protein
MPTLRDQQVEEAAQLARRMRVLKWVVSILGLLLVLAMIITVVGVIYKARHASPASTTYLPSSPVPAPAGFGAALLPLPAGCQIASATASGDRLIIIAGGASEDCRLMLVADLRTGKLIGQFSFHAP